MIGGLRAWDPVNGAISASPYFTGVSNKQALKDASSDLVEMYQGNQMPRVHAWIDLLVKRPDIRPRYHEAAVAFNAVRLIVDRLATIGQQPVRILWRNRDQERSDSVEAQKLWETVVNEWMGPSSWDTFTPSLMRRADLCKSAVASAEWDAANDVLMPYYYTPDVIEVDYVPGNLNRAMPDIWRITRDEASGLVDEWDFSPCREGLPGQVIQKQGGSDATKAPMELIDPRTKKSLCPFVAFRTDEPVKSFFIWDGQLEMLKGQDFVNQLLTQLSLVLQHGSFRQMILSGSGWLEKDGAPLGIPNDITVAIKEPDDVLGGTASSKPKVRWDGPDIAPVVKNLLESLGFWLGIMGAANRIDTRSIFSSNEPASGYSLLVESSALRLRHNLMRTLMRKPLRDFANVIRFTWNQSAPKGLERFPEDVDPEVVIPDYGSAAVSVDEAKTDVELVKVGLRDVESTVLKHNPGLAPERVARLIEQANELIRTSTQEAQKVSDASRSAERNPAASGGKTDGARSVAG